MTKSFKKLYSNENDYIAYKEQLYHKNKKSIIWFGGLNSDMEGTKAQYLSNISKKNKINFCIFDYSRSWWNSLLGDNHKYIISNCCGLCWVPYV